MIYEVENVLEVLVSGYSTEQWENKEKVDVLRYEEAKKLRNKIYECFCKDDVEYDVSENVFGYLEDLLSEFDMIIRKYEDEIIIM